MRRFSCAGGGASLEPALSGGLPSAHLFGSRAAFSVKIKEDPLPPSSGFVLSIEYPLDY